MIIAENTYKKRDSKKQPDVPVEMGLTLYGCAPDEADEFRRAASGFGVALTITGAALSEDTVELAAGNRCVSINHKNHVTNSTLVLLAQVGVEYVSTRSSGYDHIDIEFAKSVGISVGNVAYSPDSVADYTLMLLLMAVRNAKSTIMRAAAHDFRLPDVRGKELRDMTVGVIGTGRIGTAVIERLRGFGCHVIAYDHRPKTAVEYVPLDELLQRSDVVTLHAPLNADTHHLLSRRRIAQMKDGALVINTGRGSLTDTRALVLALESGKLSGAALDVLEGEEGIFYSDHQQKPVEDELLLKLQELPSVIITPHVAYYTKHALSDIVENTISNCMKFEGRNYHD